MGIQRRNLRTFDSSTLTANFQDIGDPLDFAIWRATIINGSDVDVLITDQSGQDDLRIPANGTVNISELTFPGTQRDNSFLFEAGAQLQIKQVTAAGTGTIILNLLG